MKKQTTRYFIVFYTANIDLGRVDGCISAKVTNQKPFLCEETLIEALRDKHHDERDHLITGFIELKKWEYEVWNKKEDTK